VIPCFQILTKSYHLWLEEARSIKKKQVGKEAIDDESAMTTTEEETSTAASSGKRFTSPMIKGTGKHKGWNDHGIQLYNLLDRKLEIQRDDPALADFESELKEMFLTNGKGRIDSNRDNKISRPLTNYERNKRRRMEQRGIDGTSSYIQEDNNIGQRASL
jgi:hypothetical protein